MPSKNSRRGSDFEREIVNSAKESGLEAKRAWGSNGQSLGLTEDVDCTVGEKPFKVQAKRRKTLPKYLQIPEGADVVVFRQDCEDPLVLMDMWDWFDLIKENELLRNELANRTDQQNDARR